MPWIFAGTPEPMRSLILSSAACLLLGCAEAEPQAATTDPLTARIDSFLIRAVELGFSGSVLVERNGATLIDKGYGMADRGTKSANTSATVHAIGSIVKQFTAACVLKLQEEGKLKVTDPFSVHLSDVPADRSAITLHQLLTHSAGFPGALGDDLDPIDDAAYFRLAMKATLEFQPGTGYQYSNVGYSLLAMVVERASGMPYEQYLREKLLLPAGLERTGYRLPDWSKEQLAIGYRKNGTAAGTMLDHFTRGGEPGWHLLGNGGMLSTTHDMSAWISALADGKVLSEASRKAFFTEHVREGESADSHYGYGWAIFRTPRGTRLITHNGGNGVQFADVLWYPEEGLRVVLLSNASPRGFQDIAWQIARACVIDGYEPELPAEPQVISGIPDNAIGERIRSISGIIASQSTDDQLLDWLKSNLGPGFFEEVPVERHLEIFRRLQKDIGPHEVDRVERLNAEEFAVTLVSAKDSVRYKVMLQLRPSDARISGLGVDRGAE